MNRQWQRLAILGFLLSLISGCGSLGGWGSRDNDQDKPEETVVGSLEIIEVWSERVGRAEHDYHRLELATVNGRVYAVDAKGEVSARRLDDGQLVWEQDLDVAVSAGVGADASIVVVATPDGQVIALDARTGAPEWRASVSSEVLAPPVVGQGSVVLRTADGRVFSLSAETGARQWLYSRTVPVLSLRGHSAPVLVPDGVVAGFDNGRLSALDLASGNPAWEATVSIPQGRTDLERMVDIDADPLVIGGDLFVGGYQGRVAGIALASGQIGWTRDLSVIGGLAADADNLYVTDADGQLWALDRRNGASVWRVDALRGMQLTQPVIHEGLVVLAASDGAIRWIDPRDGRILARYSMGRAAIQAPPVVVNDRVYVLDLRGRLQALEIEQLN